MMDASSYAPVPQQVAVISPQFCVADPVDLTIVRKLMTLSEEGSFVVTDANGKIMFRVKGKLFNLRERRVLYDLAGNPLVTFQPKMLSAHRRWLVFRGESTDSKDLLFSVKVSSNWQMKTKLDVFLASNSGEELCDFRIEGSRFQKSCVIYAGNSSNIIAQMHRKQSSWLGKDTFGVTVYPNVDSAFIVTLLLGFFHCTQAGSGPSPSG